MTDEQLFRYYDRRFRSQEATLRRYHTDPEYRERRRRQSAEAQRRYKQRLRQMRQHA